MEAPREDVEQLMVRTSLLGDLFWGVYSLVLLC